MTLHKLLAAMGTITMILGLAACDGDDGRDGADGMDGAPSVDGAPGANGENAGASIALSFLGRTPAIPNNFDESAAEIVAYDPLTSSAFIVNSSSGTIDIVDLSAPSLPTITGSIDVAADVEAAVAGVDMGDVNGVAVSGNNIAVAVAADTIQSNGYIAFYQTDGTFLSAVEVGALPDMVGFTPDGNYVLNANEGEPNGDYSVDPEGSVSVIDVSGGFTGLTAQIAGFSEFNAGGSKSLTGPVRVAAKASSVAADMEPEYIAFSPDSTLAFVVMQENNSVAVIDVAEAEVLSITGIGFKNYGIPGNEIDASNRDGGVNIKSWSVFGAYMPDAIDTYEINGSLYLITANEGDGREYLTDEDDAVACTAAGGFDFDDGDCFHYLDEIRIGDIADTGATFAPNLVTRLGNDFEDDANLGRLKVITDLGVTGTCASLATTGQPGADCAYENLYSFGARSFTIWDVATLRPVFDSGNDFEVITANQLGESFNASNDDNEGDDRSDDKGPEPEAVEIAEIDGNFYAFIGLERVGGVMVYNVSNPNAASFVQYINMRDFSLDAEDDIETVGDLGPEDIKFIPASDSPSGEALLLVSNEVSGTLAVFSVAML
ncbi:MAG: DNA-binding beta-propeller fold protein YncE [Glaciecola sp.]|jgi:DNA-binding beta-propeller fold protein YncE|uniref:choice-of-anchor I family protein n=1 Tax=Congregibacter sp. TaxID=2744308 RepID=UPI0039E35775